MPTAAPSLSKPKLAESRGGHFLHVEGNGFDDRCNVYPHTRNNFPNARYVQVTSPIPDEAGVHIVVGPSRHQSELQISVPQGLVGRLVFSHFAIICKDGYPCLAAAKANGTWYPALGYYGLD